MSDLVSIKAYITRKGPLIFGKWVEVREHIMHSFSYATDDTLWFAPDYTGESTFNFIFHIEWYLLGYCISWSTIFTGVPFFFVVFFFYSLFNVDFTSYNIRNLVIVIKTQIYILIQIDRSYNEKYITFSKNI